ncbi:MAG TPA: 4Fe-4S dicluster domain-containing protein [Candidatus Krumholzibacteriaceae bacterium]|nr:4Fe-4S dicluster domain-containing protein [Candidatus Krumholzibacteriaceae bacterium]
MIEILKLLNLISLAGIGLFFFFLGVTSLLEKEFRAALLSAAFLISCIILWLLLDQFSDIGWIRLCNAAGLALLAVFGIVSLFRFFPGSGEERDISRAARYDERDNIFSRSNLWDHPHLMEEYYKDKPRLKEIDGEIRGRPGFGSSKHTYFDYYSTPCFISAFEYLEKTIPASRGVPAQEKKKIDKKKFTEAITEMAKFYGASDAGFTSLKGYHLYSHRGRHADGWGEEITNTHKTAIVIVAPMNVEMFKKAPSNSVIQESARKYVETAKISNLIASYIRTFGYGARAHNDANYETLCVPLAVDAGLGELGRMGLLVHKRYGPSVRLAVVTTELELPGSKRKDFHIESFCKFCKKCSDNCPTGSISGGSEPESRGFKHWSIDQEKCFSYWRKIGSDCGICLAVCPYSKPDNLMHRLVRFYISRNILNQRVALFFDDLMYGRKKKKPKKNPEKIFLNR